MSRAKKIAPILDNKNIDALLVSNFFNILYLTGFKTLTDDEREAWVLVTKNKLYLFTDGRYLNKNGKLRITPIRQAQGVLSESRRTDYELRLIEPGKGILFHLKEIIKTEKINSLGVESEDLKLNEYEKLKRNFPQLTVVPTEKLIIKLREIKDQTEIETIKNACEITDRCLKEIIKIIKVGRPEKELAFKIEFWLKERGYGLAFDPIVAVDKNSALPHYSTKDGGGIIKNNSVILIDFGAKYKDYVSDITRMIFVKPETNILNIYNQLLTIQENTIKQLETTTDPKIIDKFCRGKLAELKLPNFPHSLGHGVGLEVHEYPKISQTSLDEIKSGQVFTIEPGVYFEGNWGMRIEDTVYINNKLKPEVLTKFNKQPLIIK